MNIPKTKITLILLTAVILTSCNAVKKVEEGELLLTENIIKVDGENVKNATVYNLLLQEPNTRLLGIPLGLHVYNLANENPDSTHQAWLNEKPNREKKLKKLLSEKQLNEILNYRRGFSNWLKKTGEEPAIIQENRVERSKNRVEEYYKSFGWFNAEADYSIDKIEDKEKRALVTYSVIKHKPYVLDSIEKQFESPVVDSIFKITEDKIFIKPGEQYSLNDFANERDRVTILLRNAGLYYFNQEYVTFIADTNTTGQKVNIEYIISDRFLDEDPQAETEQPFKIHKISKVNIITDFNYQNRNNTYQDSAFYNGYNIYSYDKLKYKPKAITDAVFIEPGEIFKDIDRTLTYNQLSELRVFKYPNISYEPDPADTTNTHLIANIFLTPRKKYGLALDFDVSTSTIQEFGIGFSSSLSIRNIFRGAETLEISGRGRLGSSKKASDDRSQFFNTSEIGGDIRLVIPRMLFPLNTEKIIPKYMSPFTNISIGASTQQNIGLDKQSVSTILNYNWTPSKIHTYKLDLLNIQYVKNLNTNNYFNVYRNAYNRLNSVALADNVTADPTYFNFDGNTPTGLSIPSGTINFLRDFRENEVENLTPEQRQTVRNIDEQRERLTEDNLIFAANISWIRDSRATLFDNEFSRTRIKLESAGNVLSAVSSLAGLEKNANDNYETFDVAFSQYFKVEADYIKYWELDPKNIVAIRAFGGVAIPYGNSNSIPFTRSYFAGGPNDNRGWLPYRLGPGASDRGDEFNEANMKLAFNAEYRYTILGAFKGAFFIDAGNIWNTMDNVTEEAAVFESFSDLGDIAVGSGFGLRYDFGFFVLRLDLGFKTYNPAREPGDRWFKEYNFENTVFNIGINYPF